MLALAKTEPDPEKIVTAEELMTSPVLTVTTLATVAEAAKVMLVNRIGSVIIVDENEHYAGILTERMMLPEEVMVPFMRGKAFRLLGHEVGDLENIEETMEEVRSVKVGDVMSTQTNAVERDSHISTVVERMVSKDAHHVCVVEDRKPIGIVSRHDLLRLFFDKEHPSTVTAALPTVDQA